MDDALPCPAISSDGACRRRTRFRVLQMGSTPWPPLVTVHGCPLRGIVIFFASTHVLELPDNPLGFVRRLFSRRQAGALRLFRDGPIQQVLMMPADWQAKGNSLNKINIAAAPAAAKPRDRDETVVRPTGKWKPYPCLLTRRELQEIIAEQLG